jgi:Mg/Co/Ni transporter MgtE
VVSLALLGGFISVKVLGLFEAMLTTIFFTPLIAAMAGNVECNLRQLLCKVWQTIR